MNWREGKRKIQPPAPGTPGGPVCRPGQQPKFVICRNDHDPDKDLTPKNGTLDPGKANPFNLYVESADLVLNSSLVFTCIDKGLTLTNTQLVVNGNVQGTLHLENNSTLRMQTSTYQLV